MNPFVPFQRPPQMRGLFEPFPMQSRMPSFEPFPQGQMPWFHTPQFFNPFDMVAVSTPWTLQAIKGQTGETTGDQWQTSLSLPGFDRDNVKVTTLDDHSVMVEAKKVKEEEGKYEYKHICRKLAVPEKVDLKTLKADFKPDGEMVLKAGPPALMAPAGPAAAMMPAPEQQLMQAGTSHPVATVQPPEDFMARFNLKGYPPESIKVKVAGNRVTVQAKEEKKSEEGHVMYRQFHQSVTMPRHIDADQIRSRLSPDGQLTVEARPHQEREIAVEMTH